MRMIFRRLYLARIHEIRFRSSRLNTDGGVGDSQKKKSSLPIRSSRVAGTDGETGGPGGRRRKRGDPRRNKDMDSICSRRRVTPREKGRDVDTTINTRIIRWKFIRRRCRAGCHRARIMIEEPAGA